MMLFRGRYIGFQITKKATDLLDLKQTFNLIDVQHKLRFSVQKPNNSAVKVNINEWNETFDV